MRVLLITDWPSPDGGVETYLSTLRAGLERAGDDVRLLASTAGSAANGHADYLAYGTDRRSGQLALQLVNPSAVAATRQAVQTLQPDIAYVSMFEMHLSPAVFAPLRNVPTVLYVSYYKPICPTGLKLLPDGRLCEVRAGAVCWRGGCTSLPHWVRDRPRYALIRAAMRGANQIVTCSDWMRRELARDGVDATHFPWPIDDVGREFRRMPAREPLFLYLGRLSREKGVEDLIEAFARVHRSVPSARLRIVGEGPQWSRLRALAEHLGVDAAVELVGVLPHDEIESELVRPWALVAPSRWAEPLGQSAIEALVRGVPVVGSERGGLAESIERDGGLLYPNGDVEALSTRLLEIAEGGAFPDLTVGDEVVRRVRERHSAAAHVARIRELFAAVAGDG